MRFSGLVSTLVAALLALPSPAVVGAEEPAASATAKAPEVIGVQDGRLTVTINDGDLAAVLRRVAEQAGFRLKTSGDLGRVTLTLEAVPLDHGLRRLAQDHELVLIYSRGSPGGGEGSLAEVRVFAASAAAVQPRPRVRSASPESLAEISRLLRARDDPQATARLVQLLATAPEAPVRARAAWGLGRNQAPGSSDALSRALQDPDAAVRIQAAYGLARVDGARAIAPLAGLLRGDPDAGVRQAAARALGTRREPAAAEALRGATGDPDASVRQEVARALRKHGAARP
jgi:hypothetical protein